MTPFDPDLRPDETPIEQDDLIAFHLHELPRQKTRALHRALRNNPNLQAESLAIATTLRAFPQHEPALPLNAAVLDRHWQTLLPNLAPHTPTTIPPRNFFPRTIIPRWTLPALAGSALVATTLLVAWHYAHRTQPPAIATLATPSSTITTPTPPEASQPNPPTNSQSNPFNPLTPTSHCTWPSTSTPLETATANPAPPIFSAQSPTPLTPTNPSTTTATTTPPATTPLPPSNATQTQLSAQPSTPSAIRQGRAIRASTPHRPSTTELTLAVFGDITASRTSTYTAGTGSSAVPESLSQAPTPAVGALASVRQQFRSWLGYRLTATYTRPTFIDTYKPTNSTNAIGTNGELQLTRTIYEVSGTYVAQGPHRGRLTTSAEAGAGVLAIQSVDTTDYPTTNIHSLRPTAVIGVGTELALTRHWGIRAEYRALLYKPPAFDSAVGGSIPVGPLTFSSNPILGITYRFGANGAD